MDALFKVKCDHLIGIPPQQFTLTSCARCLGKGYYNGVQFGPDGRIITVTGVDKLSQQIVKILTEKKRPSGYGFDTNILSGVITPSTLTAVKSEVIRCIEYLKSLQQKEKSEGFIYLPTEEIATGFPITTIDAFINPSDPRGVFVNVSILTVSGLIAEVSTQIRR